MNHLNQSTISLLSKSKNTACNLQEKRLIPNRHLFVQSQQWKHQNRQRDIFKVNNTDTRTTSRYTVVIIQDLVKKLGTWT